MRFGLVVVFMRRLRVVGSIGWAADARVSRQADRRGSDPVAVPDWCAARHRSQPLGSIRNVEPGRLVQGHIGQNRRKRPWRLPPRRRRCPGSAARRSSAGTNSVIASCAGTGGGRVAERQPARRVPRRSAMLDAFTPLHVDRQGRVHATACRTRHPAVAPPPRCAHARNSTSAQRSSGASTPAKPGIARPPSGIVDAVAQEPEQLAFGVAPMHVGLGQIGRFDVQAGSGGAVRPHPRGRGRSTQFRMNRACPWAIAAAEKAGR